jgi:hypothetical protein
MGRPPILPKKKKDGWYIEVRNKGAKSGMILIRDTEVAMFQAAKQYETTKDVLILGEHRSGKRVDDKSFCFNQVEVAPLLGLFFWNAKPQIHRFHFENQSACSLWPEACSQFYRTQSVNLWLKINP